MNPIRWNAWCNTSFILNKAVSNKDDYGFVIPLVFGCINPPVSQFNSINTIPVDQVDSKNLLDRVFSCSSVGSSKQDLFLLDSMLVVLIYRNVQSRQRISSVTRILKYHLDV
ncbi:hypothetical protein Tco_1351699 [Tanacetum coccineum]